MSTFVNFTSLSKELFFDKEVPNAVVDIHGNLIIHIYNKLMSQYIVINYQGVQSMYYLIDITMSILRLHFCNHSPVANISFESFYVSKSSHTISIYDAQGLALGDFDDFGSSLFLKECYPFFMLTITKLPMFINLDVAKLVSICEEIASEDVPVNALADSMEACVLLTMQISSDKNLSTHYQSLYDILKPIRCYLQPNVLIILTSVIFYKSFKKTEKDLFRQKIASIRKQYLI